ncbi:hypothetical protein [Amycolatopsis granulosa]|uniref:hypothetical protein n=1 Tax=Amycolatopsis granulosa TaxID=185684 RepID=UPI001422855A|nr:hypothetical protein [Amycolatopsis granulosa]NIH83795.1 hypothetical protein [Amycolatopsis granulosa]
MLGSPFYGGDAVRDQLLGARAPAPLAVPALLCLSLALAWWSTLRRGYLWADPAALTWSDFDGSRPATLLRRLRVGWALRFAVVVYAVCAGGMLLGWPGPVLAACGALFAAVTALALVAAARAPGPLLRLLEQLMPLVLTVFGLLVASAVVSTVVLWGLAAVATCAAVLLTRGRSLPSMAGRRELVERYTARMVRRTSVSFLDVWTLLPQGRPLKWRGALAGSPVVVRFVFAGVITRARSLLFALMLALTIAALRKAFPGANPVWWVGIGAYLAVLPFSAPIAQLNRSPGLRRWLSNGDRVLTVTAAGILLVVGALWFGVTLALGVPWSTMSALAVAVGVAAVVRSVTRSPIDFRNLGIVAVEGVLLPVGLLTQLARGPEVLALGLLLLGNGVAFAAPIAIVLCVLAILF